ncbi:M48 family metalloprotease [Streptomyces sp. Li-HN-5-11]|uniref:M56 family metallopeptidase n=1 Tax=Streptomyces sp. Li-HN-5-11 TaxID=3075432 RepID=UPI0028A5F861|nr:M48 family metalloprotease [Streptomyces sp. Li-HN-5-11]WNM31398.1 M48 family metalloprotease [Streptomyces sp. Li-HN-5-11]
MLISVYVPLAVTAVLTLLAPGVARRLAPRPAAWALACTALVTTVGWTGSLVLLAFTGIAQIPQVAAEGRWSVPALRAEDPVYLAVAVVSALVLVAGFVSLVLAAVRQARHLLWARRECARMPGGSELTVVDDDTPQAFALPGAPGRIVVSRGMLRCLDGEEREALLAHERAHLRGRHHVFQTLWRLAAALNPLLRPLADAGGFALERWADEDAAAQVGSRRVVARAVGRAALASSSRASSTPALAVTGGAVPQRVRALLAPPPPRRTFPIAGGALLLTLCCAGLANAASDSDQMLDDAQRAQCAASITHASVAPRSGGFHHGPDGCCEHRVRGVRGERHG